MMTSRPVRATLLVALLLSLVFVVGSLNRVEVSAQNGLDPQLWKLAPPPPQIRKRRRRSPKTPPRREAADASVSAAVMVCSAPSRASTQRCRLHYRQENNLYYLTGIKQAERTARARAGRERDARNTFMPRRDPLSRPERADDVG